VGFLSFLDRGYDVMTYLKVGIAAAVTLVLGWIINQVFEYFYPEETERCSECGRGFEFFDQASNGSCAICYQEELEAEAFMSDWDGVPSSDFGSPIY
jgi:protein-arginine kinase activator protein McsA